MDNEQKPLNDSSVQNNSKNTERALIALAVLLLLFSAGALYFDDWLWSGLRSRGDAIGMITSRTGDVRLKFDEEVSWQKANAGQSLQYNDSIFAGQNSEADIKLGESQLTVTQNSLVVLRREMDANFLNLNFGTLFGKVAKNDKVYIDTGAGKPTLLKTNSEAEIVLKKTGDKTSLEVIKGVAEIEINGVKKSLTENTQLVLPSKPQEKVVEKKLEIKILPPSPMDTIYSKDPQELHFKWSYGDGLQAIPSDRFQVEFSKDSTFATSLKKHTQGETSLFLNVAHSNQLYYRVKGPRGEVSPTYRFGFVRLLTPEITSPPQNQIFETGYRQLRTVPFAVKTGPLKPSSIWTQIAADPEFKTVLLNESQLEENWMKDLPAGAYYMRARSDFGENRLSDWSQVTAFRVKEDIPKIKLPLASLDKEVTIRNLAYPGHLYGSSDEETQEYLWQKGFLRDYFSNLSGHYDQLSLDFGTGEIQSVKDAALPKDKIYPSTIKYRYQLQKAGRLPSAWSPEESLRIKLEPPKENFVEIVGEEVRNDGKVPVKINFTPVLFAKSYDFQVATHPSFLKAQEMKGPQTQRNLKLELKKDYYWRVRALNAKGKPISGFSQARKLSSRELINQVRLARNRIEKSRKPAAVQEQAKAESRSRLNQMRYIHKHNNFWAWLGSGFSYVNYQQSISERGTLDSSSRNDSPGQYFEVGYIGDNGYGGVLGYKSTPGEVIVENATLDSSDYVWRTISLEALSLSTAKFKLFGLPINYGPRIGIQSHNIPYIFLNDLDALELKQNDMITASVGMMADVPYNRWKFHTYMRYQYPITATSGGASDFELKPKFAFDGLLGSSYYFSHNFKVGAFWYGQWHFYDFIYSDGDVTNNGSQSLFYSTMDVRFGFEF